MATPAEELDVDGTAVRLTNPDKIYFPRLGAAGGTKRHLVEYYRTTRGNVVGIHAERSIDEVFHEIEQSLSSVEARA